MRALPQLPSPTGTAIVDPRTVDLAPLQGRLMPEPPSVSQRLYPWLLLASTALAGVFCMLYLTKPVVSTAAASPAATPVATNPVNLAPAPKSEPSPAPVPSLVSKETPRVLPSAKALPGESARPEAADPRRLSAADANPYEQTNLRIQHVLSAQGPAGEDLGRVILDVPVLYRSRSLRWSPQEIARARQLMTAISTYQEKSRALREDGTQLLAAWEQLMGKSVPMEVLRADSPTLPASNRTSGENQDTIHSIEIHR